MWYSLIYMNEDMTKQDNRKVIEKKQPIGAFHLMHLPSTQNG